MVNGVTRNVADLKAAAGGKDLQARQLRQFTRLVAQRACPGLVRRAGHEYRHLEFSRQHRQPVNVVGVLVRNQDGGKSSRIVALRAHALDRLAAGNSRVHQNLWCAKLETMVLFPRLPLASTETETPMLEEYSRRLWKRE